MDNYKGYSKILSEVLLVLIMAVMAGCGGSGSAGSPAAGSLRVSLTDAPSSVFDAVNVTVSKVRVHTSVTASENDEGWADITLNPARKINLLNLANGVLEELGQIALPAGHYTQIRLVLVPNGGQTIANSVVLAGTTTEIPIDTPSAVQSGIKLINEFDVTSGQRADLVLDFDVDKSIVPRGNGSYALKPVIKVLPTLLNGIDGFVDTSLLGSKVVVMAQTNGTVVRSTVPNAQTGEFFLARLATGNYDVVITADGHATAVIAGVPVASASTVTSVSTGGAPIASPASVMRTVSGTATLNPVPATEVVAFVTAKQSFTSGPTVSVNVQAADLLTGDYTLTLPVDAPLLGLYNSVLPIVLTAQAATAGKYAVEASATGYQTQSFNVDISTTAATHNFILLPVVPVP